MVLVASHRPSRRSRRRGRSKEKKGEFGKMWLGLGGGGGRISKSKPISLAIQKKNAKKGVNDIPKKKVNKRVNN